MTEGYCCRCKRWMDRSFFNSHSTNKSGIQTWCKMCYSEWGKLYKSKPDYVERHRNAARLSSWRTGKSRPIQIAKGTPSHIGYVAETILSKYFDGLIRMPINNRGFDFICKRGYKIDVKSACPQRKERGSRYWNFKIKYNKIADYFLCLAFDDKETLTPKYVWLVPGRMINHRSGACISESKLERWAKYEGSIEKAIDGCNLIRSEIREIKVIA